MLISILDLHSEMIHKCSELSPGEREKKKWECPCCLRKFTDSKIFTHVQICEPQFVQASKGCAVCGKTFTGKYANERDNHMVEYHQEVQCKVCQQTLPNKREYKEHMNVEHKNQAKICEVKVCQMSVPLDR